MALAVIVCPGRIFIPVTLQTPFRTVVTAPTAIPLSYSWIFVPFVSEEKPVTVFIDVNVHKGSAIIGGEVIPGLIVWEIENKDEHFALAPVFIALTFTTSQAEKTNPVMVQIPLLVEILPINILFLYK